MTDDHVDGDPWDDASIPFGINARRIYEYATTVGGKRRRRRRQRQTAAVGALAAIAVAVPGGLVLAANRRGPSEVNVASKPGPATTTPRWLGDAVGSGLFAESTTGPERRGTVAPITSPGTVRVRPEGQSNTTTTTATATATATATSTSTSTTTSTTTTTTPAPPPAAHAVLPASQTNYSAARERPKWSLVCNTDTKTWAFSIRDVRLVDSQGHIWPPKKGPWSVDVWSADGAGPVPWNATVRLKKNPTGGLFNGTASGTDAKIDLWCKTGSGATVVGWSGSEQSLLLDGTFG